MFRFDFVYVVRDEQGTVKNIFSKKSNAIEAIPEGSRKFPKETSTTTWEYGRGKGSRWSITEMKVEDSNGLSYSKPR